MAKKTKNKGGRPSKFDPKFLEKAMALAKKGATNAEIAKSFDVSEATFYVWMQKYSEFSETLKEAKAYADDMVEAALFKKAIGFTQPETKVFMTKGGVIVTHEMIKHYAPDTTAQIFWLKNRRPDQWRDKPEGDDAGIPPIILNYKVEK